MGEKSPSKEKGTARAIRFTWGLGRQVVKIHKQGYIDLYFADEAYFGLTPNIPYAWQYRNEAIFLPASKSKRLTVFGLINTDCKLHAFINEGSVNAKQAVLQL